MTRLFIAGTVLLLGTSCLTEGNYPTKLGATFCKKFQECEPEAFDQQYSSLSDCKDEAREFADADPGETECLEGAGCKFNRSAAAACRSSISSASCEEVSNGNVFSDPSCVESYDCDGVSPQDIAACYSN